MKKIILFISAILLLFAWVFTIFLSGAITQKNHNIVSAEMTGKNLFQNSLVKTTNNGVTFEFVNDKYSVVGYSTAYPYPTCGYIPKELSGKTITISRDNAIFAPSIRIYDRIGTLGEISRMSPSALSQTITLPVLTNNLSVELACDININYNALFSFQVELGTTATSYEPYYPVTYSKDNFQQMPKTIFSAFGFVFQNDTEFYLFIIAICIIFITFFGGKN